MLFLLKQLEKRSEELEKLDTTFQVQMQMQMQILCNRITLVVHTIKPDTIIMSEKDYEDFFFLGNNYVRKREAK